MNRLLNRTVHFNISSAVKFDNLQTHLDGKKHHAKIKLLGGPEVFAPPQPLGPLPTVASGQCLPTDATAAATAAVAAAAPPVKKPKTEGMCLKEPNYISFNDISC